MGGCGQASCGAAGRVGGSLRCQDGCGRAGLSDGAHSFRTRAPSSSHPLLLLHPPHSETWCSRTTKTSWRSRAPPPRPAPAATTTPRAAAATRSMAARTSLCASGYTTVRTRGELEHRAGLAGAPPCLLLSAMHPALRTPIPPCIPPCAACPTPLPTAARLCQRGQREDEQEPGQLLHHSVRRQEERCAPAPGPPCRPGIHRPCNTLHSCAPIAAHPAARWWGSTTPWPCAGSSPTPSTASPSTTRSARWRR